MALETIKLGGFVEENIRLINENFSSLELGKAALGDIPAKVSQLTNDSGYQTARQVADAVAALVDSSPAALDTLKELAEALGNDPNFAATITSKLAKKVDKIDGKGLSAEDFTAALKAKLESLENYTLPVGGEVLGGVKNGGNVTINADGTMTAPMRETEVSRINFTADDSRWSGLESNVYTLTLEAAGKTPLGVYRTLPEGYSPVMAGVAVKSGSIQVTSYDKFEGCMILI